MMSLIMSSYQASYHSSLKLISPHSNSYLKTNLNLTLFLPPYQVISWVTLILLAVIYFTTIDFSIQNTFLRLFSRIVSFLIAILIILSPHFSYYYLTVSSHTIFSHYHFILSSHTIFSHYHLTLSSHNIISKHYLILSLTLFSHTISHTIFSHYLSHYLHTTFSIYLLTFSSHTIFSLYLLTL